VYDARPTISERAGVLVASDGPSRDPRSSLSSAIATAAAGADVDTTLQGILDLGVDALGAVMGAIFLEDPDRPGLTLAASVGMADTTGLEQEVKDPAHPFTQVTTSRIPMFDRPAVGSDGAEFVGAYVPLVVARAGVDQTFGSIGLGWPAPRTLDAVEREVLTSIAALAALAVDRARLLSTAAERADWFERMAHADPLTGLANERTVGRILELELARAGRQGSEVSLALFDVDDFRSANDTDGHDVGDDILRRVAAVLADSVRLVDTVGRIGGDEFVLIAPGSAGAMVSRRIQDGLAALPAVAGRSVSVSVGVARFPVDGTDADGLIAAATAALGQAKASGAGTVAESATTAG
jgi:diguanylate cyclase (GGDEF)-like protein